MAKEYNIAKTTGQCCSCEQQLLPGSEIVTTIWESDEEDFQRKDFCAACWDAQRPEDGRGPFGVWRGRVPDAKEKKKLFVDDELLINFFERLDGTDDAGRVNFRFVLALILMRKKLLVYDRSDKGDDGVERWTMHFKGSDQKHNVVDPRMDEEKIAEVSERLGEILEGEL